MVLSVSFESCELVEATKFVFGLNTACEGERDTNNQESIITISASGFQTFIFGIGLSWFIRNV